MWAASQHSGRMNAFDSTDIGQLTDMSTDGRRPLLVSSSLPLIDDVVRLASSAALEVHVASDLASAARHWLEAPLVLIGSDVSSTSEIPGKRARVVVVHADGDIDSHDTARQRDMWRFAVEVGAEHVVELPEGERWLMESFRECAEGPVRDGRVTAILGGTGGVGTSTLTVNVAMTAIKRGSRSLVVDADPWGGGLDLLFGAEEKTGARWSDLRHVSGHLPSGHLDAALPRIGDVSILSCSRNDDASATPASNAIDPTTMASVLAAGKRSHDHVFVDCSRCSDDFLTSVLAASHSAVLVVGDHVRAAAAAARRYAWLRGKISPLAVVQANSPRGIARDDIEHALGTELTAVIPHVPSMTSRADEGELPALPRAYANACDRILDVVMADARSPRRAA